VIPQTILSLVAFLFLVAPGILFELRRERRRPGRKETAFREAARTALASLLFSVAAVLVLLVAGGDGRRCCPTRSVGWGRAAPTSRPSTTWWSGSCSWSLAWRCFWRC
jgi:hypothetical protein